jgi:NADH dehydrogenase/NADH:ubiquinone oxidoreductase subunit G
MMITFTLNGLEVAVEEGTTLLEAARTYGIEIPTLCYDEALSPGSACRLCVVEVGTAPKAKLVASCDFKATEGLVVRTHSNRVMKVRKTLLEMYVAAAPGSKTIQCLASKHHVTQVRMRPRDDTCILCGLCVRMCSEQMQGKAIDFISRGVQRRITTAFAKRSDECRLCGGCMYICPVCMARCQGPQAETTLCNACLNLAPPCSDKFDDVMCYMDPCVACEQK